MELVCAFVLSGKREKEEEEEGLGCVLNASILVM